MTLAMKPQCEKCSAALSPTGAAFICTFECTFCEPCTKKMNAVCPNCGGELVPRPKKKA